MRSQRVRYIRSVLLFLAIFIFLFGIFLQTGVEAFTLKVVDQDGKPVKNYRWLVEEDTTYEVIPGAIVTDSPGIGIHKSYAPVVRTGHSNGATHIIDVPGNKRYFVTVLPDRDHAMGGASIKAHQQNAKIVVQRHPLPTAQISVLIFHDNNPINNAPDPPFEEGLAGFTIVVRDQLGIVSQDAFANPLGTTYVMTCDSTGQNPGTGTNPCLDADGNPVIDVIGTGVVVTDATGQAFVKYLHPGKYGVQAVPTPDKANWTQTATIEGTPGIDAWVKANEPPFFLEFGPTLQHVFIGFIEPNLNLLPATAGAEVHGQFVKFHTARPPLILADTGAPVPEALYGLNDLSNPTGRGVFTGTANPDDGTFIIPNLPPGTYQLVMWDTPLDYIVNFSTIIIDPVDVGTIKDIGQVPVDSWFGIWKGSVFYDANDNGIRDPGEEGISQQTVDARFRDGSMYIPPVLTDVNGDYEIVEYFPWFHMTVAEVNYNRMKATGATIQVDDGAGAATCGADPEICPQAQPDNAGLTYRTEVSGQVGVDYNPILLEAFIVYSDQTNIIDWGKKDYAAGENGGIVGVVYYSTTRAEDDPRLAAAELWEPGIARVPVNLYQDDGTGKIFDLNGNGKIDLADIDNFPFGWSTGGKKGPEDRVRCGNGVKFCQGDALRVTHTDNWDDAPPTDCVYTLPEHRPLINGQPMADCAETIRTWNQVRPGVFNGGYAFYNIPSGNYITEVVPPRGYKIQKEEDKNVVFGDAFTPSAQSVLVLPPECVGDVRNKVKRHTVPPYLSLFPDQQIPAFRAGEETPLCTMKRVPLEDGQNGASDFFLFTDVPKAAIAIGLMTNDLANQNNPANVAFGEKLGPSWIPVSFQDWAGNEITRVYTDEFGVYNALVPSTYTINPPVPTGVSPNMVSVCLNHPGPIPDPKRPGHFMTDPFFNRQYAQACLTLDFWPGKITYPDTPVIPIAAFTGAQNATLDCDYPDKTPIIYSVSGPLQGGPFVAQTGVKITIQSVGPLEVPNPAFNAWDPVQPRKITRDFGFGAVQGTVTVGGVALTNLEWSDKVIRATVPASATTGQLMVTRGDNGETTKMGVTLTVGGADPVIRVNPKTGIQAAIDAAPNGALILVPPGIYNENLFMYKPVKLQGWGAHSTIINASPYPAERLTAWSAKLKSLEDTSTVTLLLGQDPAFINDRAPGIFVITNDGLFTQAAAARIDSFTIEGSNEGGGIFVNAYADYLEIANNRVLSNMGTKGGGIHLGEQALPDAIPPAIPTGYVSASNDNINIHNNHVLENGGVTGGAGISLYKGSDNYMVTDNYICGNFTSGTGAGINHSGVSNNGLIANNIILFNESYYGAATGNEGGGIFIGGLPAPALVAPGTLPEGSGSVTVTGNLIQGNLAGAGDGGGIRLTRVNGQDVSNSTSPPTDFYTINIFNNMIVNNVSGWGGGGIALQDAASVNVINNTVANNDSTASGVNAFTAPGAATSTPRGAGIISRLHSAALQNALTLKGVPQTFSNPLLVNNIIWHNRSFYWDGTVNAGVGGLVPNAARPTPPYWDLEVVQGGVTEVMSPQYCNLTDITGTTNISSDPLFLSEYFDNLQTAAIAQEGGNFVQVTFTGLTPTGDYHILPVTSPAIDVGTDVYLAQFPLLQTDFDGETRPATGTAVDIGADETNPNLRVLKIMKAGTGSALITSTPRGINCHAETECIAYFDLNTGVTLTVNPDQGTLFSGWTGDVTSPNETINVTMDANKTVTATFEGPSITVTSPNGGESWAKRSDQVISWTHTGVPGALVKIKLLKGGQKVLMIATDVPIGKGSKNLHVPGSLNAGTDYSIEIETMNGNFSDTSNADFSIN
jgi:hypothetical protein